jgi:hypothetical protein
MWLPFEPITSHCNFGVGPEVSSSINFIGEIKTMKDNGGRRFIIDRRRCTSFDYFPERRTLRFRRSDFDRRKGRAENSGNGIERRAVFR